MPWKIIKLSPKKYKAINCRTGTSKGISTSREAAKRHISAMGMHMHEDNSFASVYNIIKEAFRDNTGVQDALIVVKFYEKNLEVLKDVGDLIRTAAGHEGARYVIRSPSDDLSVYNFNSKSFEELLPRNKFNPSVDMNLSQYATEWYENHTRTMSEIGLENVPAGKTPENVIVWSMKRIKEYTDKLKDQSQRIKSDAELQLSTRQSKSEDRLDSAPKHIKRDISKAKPLRDIRDGIIRGGLS